MLAEQIARVCHEANRAYCDAIGDDTQEPWGDAEQWQRDSAVQGIEIALGGATPEQQHDAWAKSKLDEGWTYGEAKDPATKRHPCLVPYAELPEEQKVKDSLYIAVVRSLSS